MEKLALYTPGGYNLQPVAGMPHLGLGNLQSLARWGTTILIIIAIILALYFLIWGGIQWITSRGNKESIQAAQKRIVFASIGLIITLGAFFIVNFIAGLFSVSFF